MDIDFIKKHSLILLECISGSRAYNLDVPGSDTDIKGVFYMPKSFFYGSKYIEQISNNSNDIVYYEIGRFIDLLTKNNPNILELLATPKDKILYKHPILEKVSPSDFLSKKCKDTFGGYAFTQIKKARGLNKKIANPVAKEKKNLLDFCYVLSQQGSMPVKKWLASNHMVQSKVGLVAIPHFNNTFGLYYDQEGDLKYKGIIKKEKANGISLSSVPIGAKPLTHLHFNQDGYTKYCKDYKNYWDWVENRNENRYQNNIKHDKNYDSKNMMHTFRLLHMAEEILRDGCINVKRQNREDLLKIRHGEYQYDDLIDKADKMMKSIDLAYKGSKLPEEPNKIKIEKLLVSIRQYLYQ